MKAPIFALLLICSSIPAMAQETFPVTVVSASNSKEFPIYPTGQVPDSLGIDPVKDIPTLTFFPAASPSGAAMIVCPGGGYGMLASHEGRDYALWLAQRGINAFVLKYRLGSNGYRHPAEMHDIQRAIRYVRAHAPDWSIDSARIGVIGSSAGGHLASTAATHFDAGNPTASDPVERVSSRPDLAILCYPVISMGPLAHSGSKDNLLGATPDPALVTFLSSELQVTHDTPPCFIWHTRDDAVVKVENSILFAQALQKNNVPYELHIYEHGPHGQGLGIKGYDPATSDPAQLLQWTRDLDDWLRLHHFEK
jgi:acetyl esterase/lipase